MSQLGWLIACFLVALSKIVEADLFNTNPVYVKSFTLGVRLVGQSLFLRTIKSWIFLYFLPILGWKYSCNIFSYKLMQRRCSELKSCGGPPTPKHITIKPDMNFICIKTMAFCFTCPLVLLFKKGRIYHDKFCGLVHVFCIVDTLCCTTTYHILIIIEHLAIAS